YRAYESPGHQRNFIDSVKSRKETVAPAESAHRSVTPGHLAYVSHEVGRAVKFDPVKEVIVGDDKAQKVLMSLPYRGDWKI
ncbi:MAG: gfo/Idh/MocA family oxidoreductase, partial [Roseibacillus sp.]